MANQIPRYIQRFRDALLDVRISKLSIDCCSPEIRGERGILTTFKIQYNDESINLLGREHEYRFLLPDGTCVPVSIQLYLNVQNHWRLFAYNRSGMLLSANLTLERESKDVVTLKQALIIKTRKGMDREKRKRVRGELVHCLRHLGYEIDSKNQITFGTFDGRKGYFLDTTAGAFMRSFSVAAVVKGHFMQNKGYKLPGLHYEKLTHPVDASSRKNRGRSIPDGLRYQVLERDRQCLACGATPQSGVKLHVDHITPFSQGGLTELGNLQTLCAQCNLGKGNRSTQDFR